ncbi:regulatory protein RecX [Rivibacter subsaxonicus]|uniref:Regulatory protein RecX n=1 Tax=Rivibacter subsaxonicus TaxID=457575 RepID=A0A4Q7VW82_9BURK|nr:regulatory protein RecX [Rivibacter subsaxonicus]RZU00982.1 regulatory protein [Rivibacter subsaxonicus]
MARAAQSLKAKALGLIAQREHSRVELRRKLRIWIERRQRALAEAGAVPGATEASAAAPDVAEIEPLLDWLVQRDLLSVERFVETRINVRAARFGNLRIRQELAQHGVELDAEAAQALKASEFERARAVWAKRFDGPPINAAARAKQQRFLAARGFSADVVRRVLGGRSGDDD